MLIRPSYRRIGRSRLIKAEWELDTSIRIPSEEIFNITAASEAVVERQLGAVAKKMIVDRLDIGTFGGPVRSGLMNTGGMPYSTRPGYFPLTRSPKGDPSPEARNRYAQIMQRVQADYSALEKKYGASIIGLSKKSRRSVFSPAGYLGLRKRVGLQLVPNLQFTGKMVEDMRVRVTLGLEDMARSNYTFRFRTGGVGGTGRALKRYEIGQRALMGSTQARTRVGGGAFGIATQERINQRFTATATLEIGFITKRSYDIAHWHHVGKHPRPFAFFTGQENQTLADYARDILLAASRDERFTSGIIYLDERGRLRNDLTGQFISIRF